MSMTKRMFEARIGLPADPTQDARIESDRAACIRLVFERTRQYLAPFVKAHLKRKRVEVYRSLYPDGRFPSSTKFYQDVKEAGSVEAYLTHYFFSRLPEALRQLGLPPAIVDALDRETDCRKSWIFALKEAAAFAPPPDQVAAAARIEPRPRRFRHHHKHLPGVMHDKAIHAFFTEIFQKNELFYRAHPDALFKVELLDYEDYLHSPFWFVIRNIVLYRDNFTCTLCPKAATEVHHINYDVDVLYGKDLAPVVSVCEACHKKIEFDDSGVKIHDLSEKKGRYQALRAANSKHDPHG